jgi:hypothetical protein
LVSLERRKFSTPYEIGVEDIEVYGGERADLTLGFLDGNTRCVTVEMKYFPKPDSIHDDLKKLQRFIKKNRFAVGYFVMIGRKSYPYKKSLDLTQLGFKEQHYKWQEVDSSFGNKKFQTLIVFVS